MKRKTKISNLILDIYRELYRQATPCADFDKLVNSAKLDEKGKKVINYNDYEIEDWKMDKIVKEMTSRKSCGMILKEWEVKAIRFEVYLGCSPRTKQK